MANQQIKDFLHEKTVKAQARSTGVDWAAKRDRWIHAVDHLFETIESEFIGLSEDPDVRVDRNRFITLEELHVGSYSIPEMLLVVGDEEVIFSPKAMNVVGAAGRVDVRGDRGEATLVRQTDDTWSLVLSRTPRLRLVPLNAESFLAMLQDIMR